MAEKYPKFIGLDDGRFVRIYREPQISVLFAETSEGHPYPAELAVENGLLATEEDFMRAKKEFSILNSDKQYVPWEFQLKLIKGEFDDDDIKEAEKKYIINDTELNNIGLAYLSKEEYGLAEKYFRESIRIFPPYGDPYGNLISMFCRQKKYGEALETFQEGLKNVGGISLDFVYFHGSRTYFLMEDYFNSAFTAWKGIQETQNNLYDDDPYESLYIVYLKSVLAIIKKKLKRKDADINDLIKIGTAISLRAQKLFPDSEEAKAGLYKIFT